MLLYAGAAGSDGPVARAGRRYHPRILARFLALGIPLLLLLFALSAFLLTQPGLAPDDSALDRLGIDLDGRQAALPLIGGWLVEALGLTALFLLVQGRSGAWWLDGFAAAWIAWVFRGPMLVLTVIGWSRLPRQPWWDLSLAYFLLYSVAGLLLAWLARRSGVGRPGTA